MTKKKTYVEGLLDILVARQLVTPKDADSMKYSFIERSKKAFDYFLLDEGIVEREDLLKAFETYYQVPFFDVQGYFFDSFLLNNFPKDVLLRNCAIPVQLDGPLLQVVAGQPNADQLESVLRSYVSCDIVFNVGIEQDIEDAIKEYYDKALTEDAHAEDGDFED